MAKKNISTGLVRKYEVETKKGKIDKVIPLGYEAIDKRWNKIYHQNLKVFFNGLKTNPSNLVSILDNLQTYGDPRLYPFYLILLKHQNKSVNLAALRRLEQLLYTFDLDELEQVEIALKPASKKMMAAWDLLKKLELQKLKRLEGKAIITRSFVNLTLENYKLLGSGLASQGKKTLAAIYNELSLERTIDRIFDFITPQGHFNRAVGMVQGGAVLIKDSIQANLSIYTGGHYGSFGKQTGEETFRLWMAALIYRAGARFFKGPKTRQLKIMPENQTGGVPVATEGLSPVQGNGRFFQPPTATSTSPIPVNIGGALKLEYPAIESLGKATPLQIGPRPLSGLGRNAYKAEVFTVARKNALPLLLSLNSTKDEITLFETDSSGKRYLPSPQIWKTVQINIGGKVVQGISNGKQGLYLDSSGAVHSFLTGQEGGSQFNKGFQSSTGAAGSGPSAAIGDIQWRGLERIYEREKEDSDGIEALYRMLQLALRTDNDSRVKYCLDELARVRQVNSNFHARVLAEASTYFLKKNDWVTGFGIMINLVRLGILTQDQLREVYKSFSLKKVAPTVVLEHQDLTWEGLYGGIVIESNVNGIVGYAEHTSQGYMAKFPGKSLLIFGDEKPMNDFSTVNNENIYGIRDEVIYRYNIQTKKTSSLAIGQLESEILAKVFSSLQSKLVVAVTNKGSIVVLDSELKTYKKYSTGEFEVNPRATFNVENN